MQRHYIRARSLTGLREVARLDGGDLRSALQKAGIDPRLLQQPDEPLDFAKYVQLLENCAEDWTLPDLSFRMVPYQQLEILGPVALVTRMEPTLRDALQAIIQNLVLYTNVLVAALEERGDVAAIVLAVRIPVSPIRQYMSLALAVSKNVIEQTAGCSVPFIEARFRDPSSASAKLAEAWFGCPVTFGANRDALYFDRACLDTPLQRSDVAYHAIIRRYLATERGLVTGSVTDTARVEIGRQMELGGSTLEAVAQALKIEPRNLQRRLKAEGISFRDLMDEWRRDRAHQLVSMTRLSFSEIADELGYAHQAAFSRAFQRWHGSTPLALRRRTQAQG